MVHILKKHKLLIVFFTLGFIFFNQNLLISQNTSDTFFSLNHSLDLSLLSNLEENGPFNDISSRYTGFIFSSFSAGFHKKFGRNEIGLDGKFGINLAPENIPANLLDEEIDFKSYLGINASYFLILRKNTSKSPLGLRVSLIFHSYYGQQTIFDDTQISEATTNSVRENTLGLESGIYIDIKGNRKPQRGSIKFRLEPVYIRLMTNGFSLALLNTSTKFFF